VPSTHVAESDILSRLDGELPHVELGLFRKQSEAKQAVKTEVALRLKATA
jgi:hypothetical protein